MVHNFNIRFIFCMEIGRVSLHEYFNLVYYQHYDEIINQLLNTCIILVGGRSDLFNSGGRWSKGGRDIFKIQRGVG